MSPDPNPNPNRNPDPVPASDRLRVLLIDDHTLFRSGLQELLERRGIETRVDVLREEAVEVLRRYVHSDGTIYHPEKL